MNHKPLLGTLPEFRNTIENTHDFESKIIEVIEYHDELDYANGGDRALSGDLYAQVAYEIKELFKEFINENYEFRNKK